MNPYNITKDLPGGQHAKISFTADKEGIYQYEVQLIICLQ